MPDSSAELVRIYNSALERGEPPRLSVAKYFRISITAAAGRIYRARKKGLLAPFRPKRVTVDAGELQGVIVQDGHRVPTMTDDERDAIRKIFDDGKHCTHCGGWHDRACPRVKRIVFASSGGIQEVEFWPHGQWPEESVLYPSDLEDDD